MQLYLAGEYYKNTQVGLKTAYETIMLPATNLVVNLVNRKERPTA